MNQQVQPPADMPITLSMNLVDVNKVLAGLGHLPFRDCADLIASIKQQGDTQLVAFLTQASQQKADDSDEQQPN